MSNLYSSSSQPEFAAESGYSDILGTSMPPRQQVAIASTSELVRNPEVKILADPWANEDSEDEMPRLQRVSKVSARRIGTEDRPLQPAIPVEIRPAPPDPAADPWARDLELPSEDPPASVKVATAAKSRPAPAPSVPTVEPQPIERETAPMRVQSAEEYTVSVTSKDLALQSCNRASKSLAAKDYAQARSAYKTAIEWDPQLAIAHSGLAQVFYQIQDYEAALVEWNLAISIDRTQVDFYYQRALVCKLLKNYYQVLADCKQILTQDPTHSSARWLNAVALVKTENYQLALAELDRHISTYPQDPNGYCYRGICCERLEQFTEALASFDRAIALQANQPVFHHARGRTRQQLGDLQGALADFNIAIERKPQATVFEDRGEVHRGLGNHNKAIQDCDRAIELNPKLINAYFRRGLTYAELGNLELALVNYIETIELDPQHIQAYIQRSWIHFRKEDYTRAKRDCQSAISLDEHCFWAHYVLGIVNSLLGLKNNSLTNFTKAIELAPNYVSARYHRGLLHQELGNQIKAMADFEQARSVQDKGLERMVDRDETGFYAEGLALYHLGQPEAARTILMLGALSAKRFNNPAFHKLISGSIEKLGLTSGELSCRLVK